MTSGLGVLNLGCGVYQDCSNHDPRLALTYLTSRSNLLPYVFKGEYFLKSTFLKTVEVSRHYSHFIRLT